MEQGPTQFLTSIKSGKPFPAHSRALLFTGRYIKSGSWTIKGNTRELIS